ncbi:MAG: ABC transporter substrate-binding protein [Firmicutes bacterium]|nr:ABC transporter substrate-binding protein [Bacillota bacterium]
MRKIIYICMIGIIALSFTACAGNTNSEMSPEECAQKYGSNVLKICNWGEYVGENVISDFEKKFGAKVIYEYCYSNEMMYTKLASGESYDIAVPSEYMIERLITEDMLQKLDKSLIPNEKNLLDNLKDPDYDPGNIYSIPYFWGNFGIVYNKNNVPKDDIEEKGYEILRDRRYKGRIYIYDLERDAFAIAFKELGYSINTESEKEINDAYNWLLDVNNTMDPAYVTDEVIDAMANGEKDIALMWGGDAAYVLSQNKDMCFCIPKQGTVLFFDAMVIPKNAENPKLAHEFINYILTYDASMDNSLTVGYASPNKKVFDELSGEGGKYYGNEAYIPRQGYYKDEVKHDNEVLRKKLSDLWIKVKSS